MANKHDKLQSECYLWFHNTFPEHRDLIFSVNNNLTTQSKDGYIKMARLKSLGLSKGVLDLLFYWRGCLYAFDIKTGSDSLKPAQLSFISSIGRHGGKGYVIRSIDEFKDLIYGIFQTA